MGWQMTRRGFISGTSAALAMLTLGRLGQAAEPASRRKSTSNPATGPNGIDETLFDWHDPKPWGVEGQGFGDTEGDYDCLPSSARGVVRDAVWTLSKDSTGLSVAFETETPTIAVRYDLLKPSLAMPHMPATGVSGVDLYGWDGRAWRWVGDTKPTTQQVSAVLVSGMDPVRRRYRLYLPLYNGVKKLEIGLPHGTSITPTAPRKQGAVVYYGTSIAQGGCASRPGMAFTSILSRRLDRPFVNLAFSGQGRMEESVGRFLCQIDSPAAFVLDCLPNMSHDQVRTNTEPLVRQLRSARPTTPILLVEDRTYGTVWLSKKSQESTAQRRQMLRDAFDRLTSAGVPNLTYVPGDSLLGSDNEATVDGSHPTDLGMVRYADALEPPLRKVLRI